MFENIPGSLNLHKEKVWKGMIPKNRVQVEKHWGLNLENDNSTRKVDTVWSSLYSFTSEQVEKLTTYGRKFLEHWDQVNTPDGSGR